MKSSLLLLPLAGLLSCQPKNQLPDAAARSMGKYTIQSYVMDGDTLFATNGINKYEVSDFYVEVTRLESSKVLVTKYYHRNKVPCSMSNQANVEEVGHAFKLTSDAIKPSLYEATISNGVFYERSVGMNVDSLMARLALDSLKSPYLPPYREIITVAK